MTTGEPSDVRKTQHGLFLRYGPAPKEELLKKRREVMILAAAAVFTLTVILVSSSRKGPEGWMGFIYAPPAALLILGVFWEQTKKIRMLLTTDAEKGYLVGEKGFGEVFLTEEAYLPIPEGWTSWSQFGRLEAGDNSFVVLRNWNRIVIPESMVDALKSASGEYVEPIPA